MRKTFNHFKHFFRLCAVRREFDAAKRYISKSAVVDLSPEEKAFVNLETDRMLLRKNTRIQRFNPLGDWTCALQPMPRRGSAYALRSNR